MNIHELDSFKLSDAVKFRNRLNPKIWATDEQPLPAVREKLLAIAQDFQEFLGLGDLQVKDITLSGSNAAYSYTPHSDIDLHLVVDFPQDNEIYQELFNAKKFQYNSEHNIKIGGADVELYVQNAAKSPVSQGEYSVSRGKWIQVPRRKRAQIDDTCVRAKVEDLDARVRAAIESGDANAMGLLWDKIRTMRQSGLEQHGEFGCENIVFKILRTNGCIDKLRTAKTAARDRELSLAEQQPKPKRVWGFVESAGLTPDGVGTSTAMFLTEKDADSTKIVNAFIQQVAVQLGIKRMPEIVLYLDTGWSQGNHSFGRYDPDNHVLQVSLANRHILDILRTVAHELIHCRQNELAPLPDHAGKTGSRWENQANAQAGVFMRDFAAEHPEYFTESQSLYPAMKTFRAKVRLKDRYNSTTIDTQVAARNYDSAKQLLRAQYGPDSLIGAVTELREQNILDSIEEGASGYIPKNKKEAAMPQYAMALSVDIKPGQTGHEANKLLLQTDSQGRPALLMKTANLLEAELIEKLSQEFALLEAEFLGEINMGAKNLRAEAANIGARVGMEFEMIIPNINSDDAEIEADFDTDQPADMGDLYDFFAGDHNSRRDIDRAIERLRDEFWDSYWLDEQQQSAWDRAASSAVSAAIEETLGDDLMSQARDMVRDSNPDMPEQSKSNEFNNLVIDRYAQLLADRVETSQAEQDTEYEDARQEWTDNEWDASDLIDEWLSDNYPQMSDVANQFDLIWPYYNDSSDGEPDIASIADQFETAIGRGVNWSSQYHGGRRDGVNYVVEPDGSLEGDESGDSGLEFVSPPLPLSEMLSDLNKIAEWAGTIGAYTNSSTGLHINISVPGYSLEKLDYVKLALLMGDEYVLDQFGRSANTYTKSAMGKIMGILQSQPNAGKQVLDLMKGQLSDSATKAIHSGVTNKFTSINTKTGYIEFRSPGGDWLGENFDKIENTLLRFTVALAAAINPAAYRQEYLTKLYKLLNPAGQTDQYGDMISEFAKYMAALQGNSNDNQTQKLSGEAAQAVANFRAAAIASLQQSKLARAANKDANTVDQQSGGIVDVTGATQPIAGSTQAIQQQRIAAARAVQDAQPQRQWRIMMGDRQVFQVVAATQGEANELTRRWLTQRSPEFNAEYQGQQAEVIPV